MNRFQLGASGGEQARLFQLNAFFRCPEQFLQFLPGSVATIHQLLQPVFAETLRESRIAWQTTLQRRNGCSVGIPQRHVSDRPIDFIAREQPIAIQIPPAEPASDDVLEF
jgi:hypothetical protein